MQEYLFRKTPAFVMGNKSMNFLNDKKKWQMSASDHRSVLLCPFIRTAPQGFACGGKKICFGCIVTYCIRNATATGKYHFTLTVFVFDQSEYSTEDFPSILTVL